ncbi:MAG: hypothetical protein ACM3NI_00890, partial [Bacteroidota bacterium]
VNRAIMQMDGVTQGNAAQVEELSGTSQSLAAQAERLRELVSYFKLNESTHARPSQQTSTKAAVGSPPVKPQADENKVTGTAKDAGHTPALVFDRPRNVQVLKPRTTAKANVASGDWTEF